MHFGGTWRPNLLAKLAFLVTYTRNMDRCGTVFGGHPIRQVTSVTFNKVYRSRLRHYDNRGWTFNAA
jgi:hypothetical protein